MTVDVPQKTAEPETVTSWRDAWNAICDRHGDERLYLLCMKLFDWSRALSNQESVLRQVFSVIAREIETVLTDRGVISPPSNSYVPRQGDHDAADETQRLYRLAREIRSIVDGMLLDPPASTCTCGKGGKSDAAAVHDRAYDQKAT